MQFYGQNGECRINFSRNQHYVGRICTRFSLFQGLSLHRQSDHAIVLKADANILNLWPYKYPRYKNDEIEKLVGLSGLVSILTQALLFWLRKMMVGGNFVWIIEF